MSNAMQVGNENLIWLEAAKRQVRPRWMEGAGLASRGSVVPVTERLGNSAARLWGRLSRDPDRQQTGATGHSGRQLEGTPLRALANLWSSMGGTWLLRE